MSPAVESVRELFDLTGARWTLPVLASLRAGTLRFGAVRRAIPGISQKQLTTTLRQLERDGFVERTAYISIPPRVEYRLTELGSEFATRLTVVGRFAVERRSEIEHARERFDQASADRSRHA